MELRLNNVKSDYQVKKGNALCHLTKMLERDLKKIGDPMAVWDLEQNENCYKIAKKYVYFQLDNELTKIEIVDC